MVVWARDIGQAASVGGVSSEEFTNLTLVRWASVIATSLYSAEEAPKACALLLKQIKAIQDKLDSEANGQPEAGETVQ